mgnify:CR=1 FL=1
MAIAKQVMIFIVEGPTEETALAQILSRIFSTGQIKFEIVHGDITTERRLNPRERVRGLVLQSLKLNGYRWKDIARIVQISDTDGAFIPDECVRESDDGEIHYGEDGICAGNVDVLRERNARKKPCDEGTRWYLHNHISRNRHTVLHVFLLSKHGTCATQRI